MTGFVYHILLSTNVLTYEQELLMSKQPVLHFQKVCMLPCKPCTLTCDGMYYVVLCTIKITLLLWLYKRLFPEIGDKYAE